MIVMIVDGTPGRKTKITAAGDPIAFDEASYTAPDGTVANKMLVTVEGKPVRWAHHADDVADGLLLSPGDILTLSSQAQIRTVTFIEASTGEPGTVRGIPYW